MNGKVYISGPITGTTDYVERFESAEQMLRGDGFEPVNPVKENAHFPDGTPWDIYMGECLKMLLRV